MLSLYKIAQLTAYVRDTTQYFKKRYIKELRKIAEYEDLSLPVRDMQEENDYSLENDDDSSYLSPEQISQVLETNIARTPEDRIPAKIPGGGAKGKKLKDFSPLALEIGMIHEMKEHTSPNHADIAQEIAGDHLAEDPNYYNDDMTSNNLAYARSNQI